MKAVELLETYPRAAEVINEFYHTKMIESMDTSDVSQEYKDLLKEQEFDNEYVATFVDANPRMLFDVFDEHEIYINISAPKFSYSIGTGGVISGTLKTRKEAEIAAKKRAEEKAIQQKLADERRRAEEQKNKDENTPEPSEFAKRKKAEADRLVEQFKFKEALTLLEAALAQDETVAAYQEFMTSLKDVVEINEN